MFPEDGVSEGEFKIIIDEELRHIRGAPDPFVSRFRFFLMFMLLMIPPAPPPHRRQRLPTLRGVRRTRF